MTKPKRHLPGEVAFITRRTLGRMFMLRPDAKCENLFGYLLGLKAVEYDQTIHASVVMSNHMHQVQTDEHGERSGYMRDVFQLTTRARNSQLGRKGYLWDSSEPGDCALLDVDTFIQKCLYTWLNPVRAGLVERAEDWEGFMILPRHWGKPMRFERPSYFRPNNKPDVVEFTPMPPPGFDHLPLEDVIEFFERLLREAEDAIAAERAEQGLKIEGMKKVLARGIYDAPSTPAPAGQLNPRLAGSDPERVREALSALRDFYARHQDARWRFYDGERRVRFPAGTIQMKKLANVHVRVPDRADPFVRWQAEAANDDRVLAEVA